MCRINSDLQGHLVPSANVAWVDGLDSSEIVKQSATQAQPETKGENDGTTRASK